MKRWKLSLAAIMAVAAPLRSEVAAVAHPGEEFDPSETVVWTPAFQGAWDALNLANGGKSILVDPPNDLVASLDQFEWEEKQVMPEEGWKVWAGPATEEFLRKANEEAARIASDGRSPFSIEPRGEATVALSLLEREVKFARRFYRSKSHGLEFVAGTDSAEVMFWGVKGALSEAFRSHVRVLVHDPARRAKALELRCKGAESVVVYEPVGEPSFQEAILTIRESRVDWDERETQRNGIGDKYLHKKDQIRVPVVRFNSEAEFAGRLQGKRYYVEGGPAHEIAIARQKSEFRLDEEGAKAKVVTEVLDPFGGPPPEPPRTEPRDFTFDRPFFVFLWRDGSAWPYFAAWVGDAEGMTLFLK